MSKDYPMVALGEVLTRQKDEIDIQELNTYARLTIRLKGQGIVIRACCNNCSAFVAHWVLP